MSREVIFLFTIVHEKYLYIFAIYFTIVRIYNSETFFNYWMVLYAEDGNATCS